MSFRSTDLESLANAVLQSSSQSPQHLKYAEAYLEKVLSYFKNNENGYNYEHIETGNNQQSHWEPI